MSITATYHAGANYCYCVQRLLRVSKWIYLNVIKIRLIDPGYNKLSFKYQRLFQELLFESDDLLYNWLVLGQNRNNNYIYYRDIIEKIKY